MSLTDEITLKCQCGSPIFLDDVCAIYSPSLREVANIGYDNFQQYIKIITAEKPQTKDKDLAAMLSDLTDFQYFLVIVNMDAEMNQKAKEAFRFFTHENVIFSLDPAQIVVGPMEEKHIIFEEQFITFRTIIKKMCFLSHEEDEIVLLESDSPKMRALKKKMIQNRERVAKAKKKQNADTNLQFSDLVGSVAVGGCGLNISNIWDITYYAFHDQLKRMGWREQFNINNRAALAGAKIETSQLKHWIKPIASEDN